jgi:AraC-like DNA-binding protein
MGHRRPHALHFRVVEFHRDLTLEDFERRTVPIFDDLVLRVETLVCERPQILADRLASRRYVEANGVTPARAVERLRVEAARRLLTESGSPIERIARRCGFGSEETMRLGFVRLLAVTLQDYRARFGS